jgi:hypothetical protein
MKKVVRNLLTLMPLCAGPVSAAFLVPQQAKIIIILADDLGFGDIGCYGTTKISTPNTGRLDRQGLRFTDAHAASAAGMPFRSALPVQTKNPDATRSETNRNCPTN